MKRRDILANLPVAFGLGEAEAAAAIGVSAATFRDQVAAGTMPKPRKIKSRFIWDIDELRAAFKALPHEGESDDEVDTWEGVA